MVQFIKEVYKMVKRLVKDYLRKLITVFIKETLKMINFTDKDN